MTLKSDAKFEKKNDLWFAKWHEEFGKFLSEHFTVSKLGVWWDPSTLSKKRMSFKFTEELGVITMKNDEKFEEELIGPLLTKVFNVWDKKVQIGLIFHGTEEWCKIWRKTNLWFRKWHEEFGKFSP